MSRTHLLYVAFGNPGVRMQALYAAFSALAWGDAAAQRVHIFTDSTAAFRLLESAVDLHTLPDSSRQEWSGPGDYPFRIKIAALQSMALSHPDDSLLFADADTFFVAPISEVCANIMPKQCVMHRREYPVATHPTGQLRRFRKKMRRYADSSLDLNIDMWNSGVIGLHPERTPLLREMLAGIDRVSPHFKKGLVEQFFASYHLQKNSQIVACDQQITHYWAQKEEYEAAIRTRIDRWHSLTLEQACEELRTEPLLLPPRKPKKKNLARRLWESLTEGAPLRG